MSETAIVLEKYFGPKPLRLAWERMIRSTKSDGKDYFGIEVYGEDLEQSLDLLSKSIISGEYKPQRPFKYYEPKTSRTQRTKTVLAIEDALVFQAIGNEVGYLAFELLEQAKAHVFGSRLHPEVELGLELLNVDEPQYYFFQFYVPLHNEFVRSVNKEVTDNEIQYKLETDITGFFDAIPHSKMAYTLGKLGIEAPILDLLLQCLNLWSGTRESLTLGVGIPQGPPTSSLLANLLLTALDQMVVGNAYTYYRYMDDIRIYEESAEKLIEALVLIDMHLKGLGLSLNAKKTSIEELTPETRKELPTMREYAPEETDIIKESQIPTEAHERGNDFLDETNQEIGEDNLGRWRIIKGDELIGYCETEILEVEKVLLAWFLDLGTSEFDAKSLEKNEQLRNDIVNLAYRWRLANSILKQEGKLSLNPSIIPIWLFCLEHFFWKANHYCWNLNLFGPKKETEKRLWELFLKFQHYEWVRYQILFNLGQSQGFKTSDLKNLLRDAKIEKSPLVRLGYYQLLAKHIKRNTQLFSTLRQSIRDESEVYVKKAISNQLSRFENGLPMEEINYWFGL